MKQKRVLEWSMLSMLPLLMALSCDLGSIVGGGVPATQHWTLQDVSGNLSSQPFTNVTVDKGGALSQENSPWRFPVNANCTVTMPLSGNWNGTAVHITSTGGGCGVGYILTMDGTSSGAYGTAQNMSGTFRISYSGINWPVETGNWQGLFNH